MPLWHVWRRGFPSKSGGGTLNRRELPWIFQSLSHRASAQAWEVRPAWRQTECEVLAAGVSCADTETRTFTLKTLSFWRLVVASACKEHLRRLPAGLDAIYEPTGLPHRRYCRLPRSHGSSFLWKFSRTVGPRRICSNSDANAKNEVMKREAQNKPCVSLLCALGPRRPKALKMTTAHGNYRLREFTRA